MKTRILMIACAGLALATIAGAASTGNAKWIGVWQGKLDGVPSVELTLANDAGEVEGTIVFHRIMKDGAGPHIADTEPHTLIHPHIDGNTLAFQVKRGNGSDAILDMAVELTATGNAEFRCSNCSATGTRAELEKTQ
jgi:hypothetical protein